MAVNPAAVQAAIDLITADAEIYHAITHGPIAGAGSVIDLEGGLTVPSVAKAISDLTAAIIAGNANGYVAVWANNAARLLTTPEQTGQLGIQLDTFDIYYAPSTAMGSWVYHPMQEAAADAATAVAAVAALTAALGNKMSTATYVGNLAPGIVYTAERIKGFVDKATASPACSPHVLLLENGNTSVEPLLQNHRAVSLVDGLPYHTACANTSRRCQAIGTGFVIVNTPGRLASWGAQLKAGILGSGTTGTESTYARPAIATQQEDRALPGFDPDGIFSNAGRIVEVYSQNAVTVVRTADGLILVAGATGQGVKAIFGSNVDKTQSLLQPIYFELTGANKTIRLFDVQDSTTLAHSTAVFVDDSENVWLLTSNSAGSAYSNSLAGAQNIPVRINPGNPSWAGKTVQKIRCNCTGGVYVLFTDGELWGGGGSNATGHFGIGSTGAVSNVQLLLSDVADFEVSGQENGAVLALFVLMENGDLKAAGYNANGQMGQVAGPTANKTSFVTIDIDVDYVRIGGTDNVSVIYRKDTGTFYGVGRNADGNFGQGASVAINNVPVILANLTNLVADNGGLVDLVISGYNGKHATCVVCANGKAFTCGNNTDGALANGNTTSKNTWQSVRWSPRDNVEKIVEVSAAVGSNSGPAFMWRTDHGRVLMSGSAKYGFATGLTPPAAAYTVLIASPVQLGTL